MFHYQLNGKEYLDDLEEQYPERKIIIIDSLSASSGYGMLVLQALDNQKQGMSLLENAAWLEKNKLCMQHALRCNG